MARAARRATKNRIQANLADSESNRYFLAAILVPRTPFGGNRRSSTGTDALAEALALGARRATSCFITKKACSRRFLQGIDTLILGQFVGRFEVTPLAGFQVNHEVMYRPRF